MHYLVLIFMVVFAIAALQTENLRHAVIYSGVFSLLSSFAYLFYHAPDVAIAEAVIGCTLATIIYLVALTKYTIFRVYFVTGNETLGNKALLEKNLEDFTDYMSLQLDIIDTQKTLDDLTAMGNYDVIVVETMDGFNLYGDASNYHYDHLTDFLNLTTGLRLSYYYLAGEEVKE